MKLSEFKSCLHQNEPVRFQLPDGSFVPAHFHITEAGLVTKHFIDCGGTVRKESAVTMQLWSADDLDHRLSGGKLAGILRKAEPLLTGDDLDIEIEYQSGTIGKYGVEFEDHHFRLTQKETDCLAKETCGITPQKVTANMETATLCVHGGGCC